MSALPDINLEMSVFDWFKPLDKVLDTVDKAVTDQDLKNELKAGLQQAEIDLRGLAQKAYIAELGTKTTPLADSIHKLARPGLSLLSLLLSAGVLIYYIHAGNDLDLETMLAILGMNGPTGVYNYIKGAGYPVRNHPPSKV